jgi:hypothetical protein
MVSECTDEEWRPILGFPGYSVSDRGRVRSETRVLIDGRSWRGRIMAQKVDKHGYANVCLCRNGDKFSRRVAFLVAEAWHGPRPDFMEVAHGDGDRLNNRASNLRWSTHVENEADKRAHGTVAFGKRNGKYTKPHRTPRGESSGRHKLTEDQVRYVLSSRKDGVSSYRLAKVLGVSKTAILFIRSGKNWAHISNQKP